MKKILVFEVVQPVIRHGQRLEPGARIEIKATSSRVHLDRWLKDGKLIALGTRGVCRKCGCTDKDCRICVERTGWPCSWVDEEHTLCSACHALETIADAHKIPTDSAVDLRKAMRFVDSTTIHEAIEYLVSFAGIALEPGWIFGDSLAEKLDEVRFRYWRALNGATFDGTLIEQASQLRRRNEELERDAATLSQDVYLPGTWKCGKCGFEQNNRVLNVQTGNVTAPRLEEVQVCPNDGELMRRVKWREASEDNYRFATSLLDERDQLRQDIAKLLDLLAQWRHAWRTVDQNSRHLALLTIKCWAPKEYAKLIGNLADHPSSLPGAELEIELNEEFQRNPSAVLDA